MDATRLFKKLSTQVKNWNLAPSENADEITSDAITEYLKKCDQGTCFLDPAKWLLVTAKWKRLELRRLLNPMPSATPEQLEQVEARSERRKNSLDATQSICNSKEWEQLPEVRQYVLKESIMFERPLAEVAREIGVKRSTAKSWVKRSLCRLAKDENLRLKSGRGDSNG